MDLHLLEEETKFKARSIALASTLKIEPVDGRQNEGTHCPNAAADATLSQSLSHSVWIAHYSDVNDLILAKCFWTSK